MLRSRVFYFLEISLFLDLAGCNFSYSRLADEFTVGLGPTGMTISYYLWIGIILLFLYKIPPSNICATQLSCSLDVEEVCAGCSISSLVWCVWPGIWNCDLRHQSGHRGSYCFFSISPQRKYRAFLRTDKILTLLVDGHPWRADNRKVYP